MLNQSLAGVRVLDFSRVFAGPLCTMLLADLGAEVLKIERPGAGDDTRAWGPPFAEGESAYYLGLNRGKRSLLLDLGTDEGAQQARDLAAKADVLVENFRAGWMAKRGLGYDQLHTLNPGLVYCSITGFGQDGPDADLPGYDFLVQGRAGLMSITGERDGPPLKVGVAVSDHLTGLYAAVGNDAQWRRCCAALERPEWADDPRFGTNAARVANRDALCPLLRERLRQLPRSEWLRRFRAAGVPAGPVQSVGEVFADPQMLHRGMLQRVEHPTIGELRLVANPLLREQTPNEPPPRLGEGGEALAARWLSE